MFKRFIFAGLLSATCILAIENEGDDPLQWLRDSIPGEPGVDYPIFSSVEETAFNCDDKVFGGYYADPELGCQAYHICLLDPIAGSMYPTSFLCPNGTLFQQQIFNCDWWYNVDCSEAESLYGLAEAAFGTAGGSGSVEGDSGGQCPAADPLPEAECSGIVSNCWSPGQPDTDCPNFGLCCFDGCANTCVDGPAPQAASDVRPVAETTTPRTTPRSVPTSTGYQYPTPEVTLPIRPVTTTLAPPSPTLPTLYGAPPESVPQRGGRGRRGRRGRRLRNGRRRAARRINKEQLQDTYVFVK